VLSRSKSKVLDTKSAKDIFLNPGVGDGNDDASDGDLVSDLTQPGCLSLEDSLYNFFLLVIKRQNFSSNFKFSEWLTSHVVSLPWACFTNQLISDL
jgi:hypothetical protein